MEGNAKLHPIIWAMDALQDSPEIETRCFEIIQSLIGQSDIEVEPVCVLPPYRVNSPFDVIYPPFPYLGEQAIESLKGRLQNFSSTMLSPPKIIDKPVMSTAGAVRELSKYAEERKADLIVVGTHCRKGISRFFLGSFAESLLLNSRTPLLMVGIHMAQITKFDSIFFPTDFGRTSELVFLQVVDLAKSLQAKLFIYHMVQKPVILPAGLAPSVDLPRIMKEEKIKTRERLDRYLELAKQSDLKAEIIYEFSGDSESEAILKTALTKHAGLIAMAAQSGAVRSTIIGSTTRQVVRGAPCPVWVLHARGIAERKAFDTTEEEVMSDLVDHGRERESA